MNPVLILVRLLAVLVVLVFGSFVLGDSINERAKHEYTYNPKAVPHEVLAKQWVASWFCFWIDWDRVNTYQVMYQKRHLIEPAGGKQMWLRELRKDWPNYTVLQQFVELREQTRRAVAKDQAELRELIRKEVAKELEKKGSK